MNSPAPQAIHLRDYSVPDFLINETHLNFQLGEVATTVSARLIIQRNPAARQDTPLVLDGCELETRQLTLDRRALASTDYSIADGKLTIHTPLPEKFELETVVMIKPHKNTSLEGLYKSRTMFCTQCEAEGFRKITWYLDRPDVMSVFTVTILGDAEKYPVLLSNGNLVKQGKLLNGMHWATWHDPFPKPCYLFALVAGDLQFTQDTYTTRSGRRVILRIFVEAKDLTKCSHAMSSLKKSMVWDEKVYGREYDLDIYMIVAVDDFNMGAMENKGLNIFNTSCVLARPELTTDKGFQRVEAVVAHEYFHNWSGNRVTCRDWFQLSLKEGFTVFRDSCFSADMGSSVVKRVEEVNLLRVSQFAEDAGPMAHPVQPPSYIEISNFYTATVYEKGSEVVRMLHCLLGPALFRRGTDLYFSRHDGQAVTIEEFVRAMEEVSGRDFSQFRRWYTQAGTPVISARGEWDAHARSFTLHVTQSCPATPESSEKLPFHIPFAVGLPGEAGAMRLTLSGHDNSESEDNTHLVLELTDSNHTFVFENLPEKPVPSLLRNFSAPVKLQYPYSRDELMFLMSHDTDGFNRWEASQQLGVQVLQDLIATEVAGKALHMDNRLIAAYRVLLQDIALDPAMVALMLELPTEQYLSEEAKTIHAQAIHTARLFARRTLARELKKELQALYQRYNTRKAYSVEARDIAERSLKNTALSYLMLLNEKEQLDACLEQYAQASNMTDAFAALSALVNCDADFAADAREKTLRLFYRRWQQEPLAVNLWFQLQACSRLPGTLENVHALMKHEAFDICNPNKVRAVIGAFCAANPMHFHAENGSGYEFLADQVIALDKLNPQVAARLLAPLTRWQKHPESAQKNMRGALRRVLSSSPLSADVYEVASKSVGDD
jgi:aminopeptidase N